MNQSKIQLSAEEMQLVLDSGWILTKQRIIEKVYQLFGNLSVDMNTSIKRMQVLLPEEVYQSSPKISKGEQYEALPYVVLDYPRCFSKEHVFAIRTFFWWGNYFSISLHLKGKFLQQFAGKIEQALKENRMEGYYVSYAGDEFSFNLMGTNYFLTGNRSPAASKEITGGDFLKLSDKIPLEEWNAVPEKLMASFLHFMNVLAV